MRRNGQRTVRLGTNWFSALAFLSLGLFVFLWGTSYKLSLYHTSQPASAPAKLCTRASEAAKAQVVTATLPPAPTPEEQFFAGLRCFLDATARPVLLLPSRFPEEENASPQSLGRHWPQVALRPPPVQRLIAA